MTIRFGLNSWTTGDAADLLRDIQVASEAGYDVVEARDAKIEQLLDQGIALSAIRDALETAGIGLLSVSTLEQATLAQGAALDVVLARCRTLCRYAQELGAPYVIAGPSYLPDGVVPDRQAIRAATVRSLALLAGIAAESGVRIAFEFHGYERCSVNTLTETCAILDALGDPSVGLVVDSFHFYAGGSDPAGLAELGKDRLVIVHLADVDQPDRATLGKGNRIFPGLGVLPFGPFLDGVRAAGYAGAYSLELFRPEYWAMDPADVARAGLASMRSVL